MSADLILFLAISAVAIGTALAMLFSRNAVYSALFLVVNFLVVALLYLLLEAAFIAMVQVTVYAGAIMVLFLFVVMLLGTERLPGHSPLRWQLPVGVVFGAALVGLTLYALVFREPGLSPWPALPEAFGSPEAVGMLLYREYLIPVEVTSILLLVSMVGAIVLTRRRGRRSE